MSGSVELILDAEMKNLLSDTKYITMSLGRDDFMMYLEETYFTPGTEKNGELETIMGSMLLSKGGQTTFWVRIKNTRQNRQYLYAALQEYYNVLLPKTSFQKTLRKIRKDVIKIIKEHEQNLKNRKINSSRP